MFPETNIVCENWWLGDDPFLLGHGLFSGAVLSQFHGVLLFVQLLRLFFQWFVLLQGEKKCLAPWRRDVGCWYGIVLLIQSESPQKEGLLKPNEGKYTSPMDP